MKKILVLSFISVFLIACGSTETTNNQIKPKSVTEVQQGSGPSVDTVFSVSASQKSDVETLLKNIVGDNDNTFDSADTTAVSAKALLKGSSSSSSPLVTLCNSGKYERKIDSYEQSSFNNDGFITFDGSILMSKISNDSVDTVIALDANFDNYAINYSVNGAHIVLDGIANMTGDSNITKGVSALCEYLVNDRAPTKDDIFAGNSETNVHAEFSISGGIGAALVYDVKVTSTSSIPLVYSSEDDSAVVYDFAIEGSAEFKSGEVVINCKINKNDSSADSDTDSYAVVCE